MREPPNPTGLCQCGCGQGTTVVRGEPRRFVNHHHLRAVVTAEDHPNPSGLCLCGCGQPTAIAPQTRTDRGWVRGQPRPYVVGHGTRGRELPRRPPLGPADYVVEDRGYDTPCWIWRWAKNRSGYGVVGALAIRSRLAHRAMYEQAVGPVPDGLELDHLCRQRACVNPAHLEPVTHAENLRRARAIRAAARA